MDRELEELVDSTKVYNLSGYSKLLLKSDKHRALGGLLKRTLDFYSIRRDLSFALDCCNLYLAFVNPESPMTPPDNKTKPVTALSIIVHAIILYVRSTKSNTNRRRIIYNDTSHLTLEEKGIHKRVCELRDDSIAHYGPSEISSTGLAFTREILLLVADKDGPYVKASTQSGNIGISFIRDLKKIVEKTLSIVAAKSDSMNAECLTGILNGLNSGVIDLEQLEKFRFDYVAHEGSREEVANRLLSRHLEQDLRLGVVSRE